MAQTPRIDVDSPLWDQSTFYGRFRHFAWMTNPLNTLHSSSELEKAKTLVQQYRVRQEPPGTTHEQVRHAMKLYASSFHPDTGELQNVIGRMSFQVPGGMTITGAMMTFYKTTPAVIFWQWFNQSFNALVNFTNRNAECPVTETQLAYAYVSATASALVTAVGLRKILEGKGPPLLQRFVPFLAVGGANCVNIPMMRQAELTEGVDLRDDEYEKVGVRSKTAAAKGIGQVLISRNVIMAPGMLLLPFVMQALERKPWFMRRPSLHAPFQVFGVGCLLTFMVPVGCALYPQTCEIDVHTLEKTEPDVYKALEEKFGGKEQIPQKLYFNKGL